MERRLGSQLHSIDWASLNHNLFTALKIQKIGLSFAIATIIIVAAFVVIAALIMIVMEKKREIAILKAMGATDWSVLLVFLVQGMVIGVVGTALGLLLGGAAVSYLHFYKYDLDPKVYLVDHLPVEISMTDFTITSLVAMGICWVATMIPSWWAVRMLPVDGIRRTN